MKKFITLLLAVMVVMSCLVGCGKGGNSALKDAAGTYKCTQTKMVGDEEWVDAESTLELKANGKGVHHRNDLDIDIEWTLEGENFTMKETFMGMTIDYTGTLKDGKLDLFNGDPEDIWTYEYDYVKQ